MFEAWTSSLANQAGAWLLTYTLHSTLLLSLAWLASRRLSRRSVRLEEVIWRGALVGAVLTASLQLAIGGAGREPLAGRWQIGAAPVQREARLEAAPAAAMPAPLSASLAAVAATPEAAPAVPAAAPEPASAPSRPSFPVSLPALSTLLLGLWALGAVVLSAGYLSSYFGLFRRLRHRPRVVGGDALRLLEQLAEQAGLKRPVTLSSSTRVPVPVALGMRQPEICLPPRAFFSLTPEQQEALLAHEMGHLVRRDPFWLAFGRLLTGVLFFQPLNWVAFARLREISELLCDEWAVSRTGRPLSLAGCLAEVAGWSVLSVRPLPAPGMADRPSHLALRIRRLLEEARAPRLRAVQRGLVAAGVVLSLAAVVMVAPGVSAVASPGDEPAPAAPSAAPVPPEDAEDWTDATLSDRERAEIDRRAASDAERDAARMAEDDSEDRSGEEAELKALAALGDLGELGELAELSQQFAALDSAEMAKAFEAYEKGLSDEDRAEIARHAAQMAERYQKDIGPRLQEITSRLDARMEELHRDFPTAEMKKLEAEMEAIADRIADTRDRELESQLEADVERLAQDGISEQEKAEIREKARALAAQARPSEADLARIRALAEQHRELARKYMEEHREEIQALREEARQQSESVRQETRRRMQEDREQRRIESRERRERRTPTAAPAPRPHPAPPAPPAAPAPSALPAPKAAPAPPAPGALPTPKAAPAPPAPRAVPARGAVPAPRAVPAPAPMPAPPAPPASH